MDGMIRQIHSRQLPTSIALLSILLALYVDIKPLNWSLVYGYNMGEGLMNILYPVVVILIILVSFFNTKGKKKFSIGIIVLSAYLIGFYLFSTTVIGPPETKLKMLLVFVFASFIIPSISVIDAKTLLRGVMLFPAIAIVNLSAVFVTTKEWTNMVSMDVSYGFLIPIIGAIIYFSTFFREDKGLMRAFMLVLLVINATFLLYVFLRGSRGPLLSILLVILFLYLVKKDPQGLGIMVSKGKTSIFIFALFFVLLFFMIFTEMIVNALSHLGIDSYALTKILELDQEGDISNGRSALNIITINGILEHPILGNGFDRYNANTGFLYPHNFILQILYDGGLLYFFVLMIPLIRSAIKKYRFCTHDEYIVLTFLMFSSVPGALFSHNLYTNGILWLFFGVLLSEQFVYNRSN